MTTDKCPKCKNADSRIRGDWRVCNNPKCNHSWHPRLRSGEPNRKYKKYTR